MHTITTTSKILAASLMSEGGRLIRHGWMEETGKVSFEVEIVEGRGPEIIAAAKGDFNNGGYDFTVNCGRYESAQMVLTQIIRSAGRPKT